MRIATHQASATGTVLKTDCRNNNDVSYTFPVQGSTQDGHDSWIGCRTLRPGDQLPISFSSRDPAQNMAGDGYARFLSETIAILLASVLGSIVVVVVFVYPFGKQKNQK
jgi:hypothetical protein